MTEVHLSARGRRDLVDIRRYGNEHFGADASEAYFRKLEAALDLLARHPLAGSARPELGEGFRCLTRRNHSLFYRIDGDVVLIVRVLHHAMDVRRALSGNQR